MASLHYYYGTMNAGKSTNLLQTAYNYEERKMGVITLKPAVDTRDGITHITSRIGLSREAKVFQKSDDLFYEVSKIVGTDSTIKVVVVDEAQFLTEAQVIELTDVVDVLNIPVICYGLLNDFANKLFPGSAALITWSDRRYEIKTICHCGAGARHVLRLNDHGEVVKEGEQIVIGGNSLYVSVCRKHYKLGDPGQ